MVMFIHKPFASMSRLIAGCVALAAASIAPAADCDPEASPRLLEVMTNALQTERNQAAEVDSLSPAELGQWIQDTLNVHRSGMPIDLWVVDHQGRILYSDQTNQIGQSLGMALGADSTGVAALLEGLNSSEHGCAQFALAAIPGQPAWPMESWWRTVRSPHNEGATWRVLSAHLASLAGRTPPPDAAEFNVASLQQLAQDAELIRSLSQRDDAAVMALFESVATQYRGIYSLAWIDATVVQRFGFPPENSLFEVDIKQFDFSTTPAFVAAVENREVFSYQANLLEGGRGEYTVVPIGSAEDALGALLWLRRF
jgi:hypothetical protein